MESEWPSSSLGDLCLKIGSGATPRGGSNVYVGHGARFIRSQNVYDLRFERAGLAHLDDSAADQLRGVAVKPGDALINITGDSVARACLAAEDGREARVSQHVAIVRPDPARVVARFLVYWLVSPRVKAHLLTLASAGATRKALTKGMLGALRFPVPSVEEQRRIVSVLGALDDKIDSNRRLARLLEEAAATVFRARFVDFVGVEEFEDAEMGRIPIGWASGTVRDLAKLRYGQALRAAERIPGSVAVVGSSGVVGTHTRHIVEGPSVVIGRKGTAGSVMWVRGNSWPIDTTFFAEPAEGVNPTFLYFTLLDANLPKLTENSGVPGLSRDAAERHTALVPSRDAMDEFASVAEPLFWQRDRLIEGVETLTAIRDALLPRLVSGQIRVPDTHDPQDVIGPAAEQFAARAS
jgi:type I restriction enzyme S subunit